jgi:hypothetical protein
VAATGQVFYGPGHHTGYRLPNAGPSGGQSPCGAYLVIDTDNAYLPDEPGLNGAVATFIWEHWQDARRQWAQHLGPDRLTLVHHDMRLTQGALPPATAGP